MTNNNDEKLIPLEEFLRRQHQTDSKALDNFLAEKAARAFASTLGVGDVWCYVHAWGFWLKWNGRYWQREKTQLVTWYVRMIIAKLVKQDRRRVSGNLVAIVERLAQSNREQARSRLSAFACVARMALKVSVRLRVLVRKTKNRAGALVMPALGWGD
jgi:hypothetical protein